MHLWVLYAVYDYTIDDVHKDVYPYLCAITSLIHPQTCARERRQTINVRVPFMFVPVVAVQCDSICPSIDLSPHAVVTQ